MKKETDSMFDKGFNIAYHLELHSPKILERAMIALNGDPKEFFEGMRAGQIQSRKEIEQQNEKDLMKDQEKTDREHRTIERDREAKYLEKEKLKKETKERERVEKSEKISQQIKKEFDNDPFEQKLLKEHEVALKNESKSLDSKEQIDNEVEASNPRRDELRELRENKEDKEKSKDESLKR